METMQWLLTLASFVRAHLKAGPDQEGSTTLETVIIAAVLSGAAIGAVALIVTAINGHAGQIK